MIIKNRIEQYQKKNKIYLVCIIALSCLIIASICLFIFLSNYKIEVLLSVVGSIVNSILAILLVGVIFVGFLPTRSFIKFYKTIENDDEEVVVIEEIEYLGQRTIKKNITLERCIVNEKEYFVLNNLPQFKKGDSVIISKNYICGVKNENQ